MARWFLTPFSKRLSQRGHTGQALAEMTVVLILGVAVGTQQCAVRFGAANGIHGDEIGHGWRERESKK